MEEQLQNQEVDPTNEGETCGGLPKPEVPVGQVGEMICEDGKWKFVQAG